MTRCRQSLPIWLIFLPTSPCTAIATVPPFALSLAASSRCYSYHTDLRPEMSVVKYNQATRQFDTSANAVDSAVTRDSVLPASTILVIMDEQVDLPYLSEHRLLHASRLVSSVHSLTGCATTSTLVLSTCPTNMLQELPPLPFGLFVSPLFN
ncbi:hypothetical protein VTK56DRAFT_7528 [Thermocarpiscus australiensis]